MTGLWLVLVAASVLTLIIHGTVHTRKKVRRELAAATDAAVTLGRWLRRCALWLGASAYAIVLLNVLAMKISGGTPLYPPSVAVAWIGCSQFCLVAFMAATVVTILTALFDYRQLKHQA